MNPRRTDASAAAFLDVIRAYADRVHDDVRRIGCTPGEAAEVVESSALALLESLRLRPDTVPDVVGIWFKDARMLAARVRSGEEPEPDLGDVDAEGDVPAGLIRRSADDALARQSLTQLVERDRIALLLRDAYDLPYVSVAVALGVTEDSAASIVAQARLRFLELAADTGAPSVDGHEVPIAELSRLVDGTLSAGRERAVRGHSRRCATCSAAEPQLAEARRLLTGLAILAMPDSRRDALLTRVSQAAKRLLPSSAVMATRPGMARPSVSLVLACLGGAILLGGIVGAVSSNVDAFGDLTQGPEVDLSSQPTPSESASATATATASATATATAQASVTARPSAAPTASASPSFFRTGPAEITLSRGAGRNCDPVNVRGTNWTPGRQVRISYYNSFGAPAGASARAMPDRRGSFTVSMRMCDSTGLPGLHEVRATNGIESSSATYTATT